MDGRKEVALGDEFGVHVLSLTKVRILVKYYQRS